MQTNGISKRYKYKTKSDPDTDFLLSVKLTLDRDKENSIYENRRKDEFEYSLSVDELPPQLHVSPPSLIAKFILNKLLIQIRNINSGDIVKGQRFVTTTVNHLYDLTPEATHIEFVNVTHPKTSALITRILKNGESQSILESEPDVGALIHALRSICYPNLEAYWEQGDTGNSCYRCLKGQIRK